MRLLSAVLALGLFTSGCDGNEPPPPPPPRDAGPRMDAGPPGPRRDAGRVGPLIDGVIDEAEWASAESAELERDTDVPGSVLTRLLARVEGDFLFVAVEGSLAADNRLVVYVDAALDEADGIADLSTIDDTDVGLDRALSSGPATPMGFAADVAFGTDTLPRTVTGLDGEAGWRVLADPMDLTWVAGEDGRLICGAGACEAALPLETLGGTAPRTIALFARIVTDAGAYTNQTLPDDPSMNPGIVTALLTVEDGVEVDAGAPDAGAPPDAGPTGIVIDGVIRATEWAGATPFVQTFDAAGGFAGNRLSTLRALRQDGRLYLAIETTLLAGNAVVVYVDHDLFGADGLTSPTPLVDTAGALDRAISRPLFTPAEVRLDYAWGTLDLGRAAAPTDDRMGWRDIGFDPSNLRAVDGGRAPTVCGAGACETSITLADLAVGPADAIGLFARLVSATSAAMSNQTLPVDDPSAPELVSVYVQLDP